MIGLFAASAAGRQAAAELAGRLGPAAVLADGPVRPALERLWPQLDAAVFLLATDSTIRLLAPLLRERHNDPAVVCVDEAERFAVALIDGPAGNARDLAEQVAEILGGTAVVTAAEHATGTTPLDELAELLDAAVDGDLTACGAAVLAGERVRLANPLGFPLPALPANVLLSDTPLGDESPQWTVLVDDRLPSPEPEGQVLRLVPRTLVVGIGAGSGVSTTAVTTAVAALTDEHRLDHRAVLAFATVDTKATEPGIAEAVEDHGFWTARTPRLLHYPATTLATIQVPNPSPQVNTTTGTPSVAEAAALHAAATLAQGAPTELAAEKTPRGNVTVAAARIRPRGRLAVIDLGPGHPDLRVPRAEAELRKAAVVVGTEQALSQVRTLVRPGTELWSSGNPQEAATQAVDLATAGRAVALLSPIAPTTGPEITVIAVPGLSPTAVAATALLSAPPLPGPQPTPAATAQSAATAQPTTAHQPPTAPLSPADSAAAVTRPAPARPANAAAPRPPAASADVTAPHAPAGPEDDAALHAPAAPHSSTGQHSPASPEGVAAPHATAEPEDIAAPHAPTSSADVAAPHPPIGPDSVAALHPPVGPDSVAALHPPVGPDIVAIPPAPAGPNNAAATRPSAEHEHATDRHPTTEPRTGETPNVAVPTPFPGAAPHRGTTAPGGHIELLLSAAQPWPEQEQRLRGLAASDLPLWLSPTTAWQTLATEVLTALLESRGPDTPAGVVRNPGRPDQAARWIPLAELDPAAFDASTAVVIGVAAIHRAPGH
ncbi:cobalamin biosynthesis protein [Crossiella cryophila]|uniref:Cobalamin biosynthesis protein CbiG/precorrin-3B methylase n=1 Tax=Crossiella cryophila TaxID=43355 RepID=A0A7W7FY28_9PSEU|nr:cobalamin biosynthesis protein [Crossiella cryophila]MBB4681937.1 cobalamin biosynthesis protein CbiG/precorrin-3B methylase [Crossiella cryophila]